MKTSYYNFMFSYIDSNNLIIEHTKKVFSSTPGGNFRSRPYKEYTETVTPLFYQNFVQSIPFFNGFGGGSCRAYSNYTAAGYIPTKITTISPDRKTKNVDTFTFTFI